MYRTPGIQKGPVDSRTRRLGWIWDGGRRVSHGGGYVGVRRGTLRGDILLVSQLKQLCSGRSGPVHYTEDI